MPARSTRQQVLLHVPYARVSTVKEGLFVRLPRSVNSFLSQRLNVDLFCDMFHLFGTHMKSCVFIVVYAYVCARVRVRARVCVCAF